jgi:YD repeat-containing protein
MYEIIHTTAEKRLSSVARLALVTLGCVLWLVAGGSRSEAAELPNTAAGRCASAYFAAFNSGNNKVMQTFFEEHYALGYLETHPIDARTDYYQRLYGIFGKLSTLRIALSLELQLTVLADAAKAGNVLVMRFQLENEPPYRLAYVTYSAIDKAEVPDGYVDYVATRAAPVDSLLRASTVQSVAEVLRDQYVYPELGRQVADALERKQAEGDYEEAGRAGKLADMLTEDALSVSNDKHIWVEAQNPMVQESSDPVNRPVEELRRDNYDFKKVEALPGNIGYIKFDMIHDDKEALDIAAAAMDSVAQCDALIFDIRDNIGGEWGTANLILGYLLPGGTVFGYMYDRDGRRVEERKTPDSIPGRPIGKDVPVYVLTSNRTGSAAEGFAYTLKSMDRATLVGETTIGMAHPSQEVVVNGYFRVSVPYLRTENIVTGTSFEGVGVVPQIEVAADKALDVALQDAPHRIGDHK